MTGAVPRPLLAHGHGPPSGPLGGAVARVLARRSRYFLVLRVGTVTDTVSGRDRDSSAAGSTRVYLAPPVGQPWGEAPGAERRPPSVAATGHHEGVDPAVLRLAGEVRHGQEQTVKDVRDLAAEVRGLREQAPGKPSLYLASSVVGLALVCVLGLLVSRGVDVGEVTEAVRQVSAPAAPP